MKKSTVQKAASPGAQLASLAPKKAAPKKPAAKAASQSAAKKAVAAKASGKTPAGKTAGSAAARSSRRGKKSAVDVAIAKELAPAAAIAVLEKSSQATDATAPALDVLAAGVTDAERGDKLRVQLMFDNGAVLPVEMSTAAGEALAAGLSKSRRAPKKRK